MILPGMIWIEGSGHALVNTRETMGKRLACATKAHNVSLLT